MAEPRELSYEECERLLGTGVVGRVAVSTPTGPHIIPINYSFAEGDLVFRTTPYSVLGTFGRNSVLAFEIDQFDYESHQGWSVLARGRADAITDPDEMRRIREAWAPRPWADGSRSMLMRLRCSELTGRRLGDGWAPGSDLPVQRFVAVS